MMAQLLPREQKASNRGFPQSSLPPPTQSLKREAMFPPSSFKQAQDLTTLQPDHLNIVELDKDYWWPCLVVPNALTNLNDIFGDIASVNPNMQVEHWVSVMHDPAATLEFEATVLLGNDLNGYKRSYINHKTKRLAFSAKGGEYMNLMISKVLPKLKEIPGLKEAVEQTQKLLGKLAEQGSSASYARGSSMTNSTEPSHTNAKSSSATVVSFIGDEDPSGRGNQPSPKKKRRTKFVEEQARGSTNNLNVSEEQEVAKTPVLHPQDQNDANFEMNNDDDDIQDDMEKESENKENVTPKPAPKSTKKKKAAKKGSKKKISAPIKKAKKKEKTSPNPNVKYYTDTGEKITILKLFEVQQILEDCGYSFEEDMYARPYGNPRHYPGAQEGKDYFRTEAAFRAHLCAHGAEYAAVAPSEDNQLEVLRYCRYHILGDFLDMRVIPQLSWNQSIKIVRVLRDHFGIKYKGSGLIPGYMIPWEKKIYDDPEIFYHLARVGFPDSCECKTMDDMSRLALLQELAERFIEDVTRGKLDFFSERSAANSPKAASNSPGQTGESELEEDVDKNKAQDKSEDSQQQNQPSSKSTFPITPGIDKAAIAEYHRAPDHVTPGVVPRNYLGDNFDRQAPVERDVEQERNSPHKFIKEALQEKPAAIIPGKNVGEKLQSCLDLMKADLGDGMIVGEKLSAALDQIATFLQTVVDSRGLTENAFLHVCGAPGSGKTMGIGFCCNRVKQYWKEEAKTSTERAHLEPPKFIMINCSELQNLSKSDAMKKTQECIGLKLGWKQLKRPKDLDKSKKSAIVLILDEIDMLVSKRGNGMTHSGTEEYLKELIASASDPNNMLSLVGISNSVDNDRLKSLGFQNDKKIVFHTYNKDDLVKIVTSKIGDTVVHTKAVELLAKKVAATSGDARTFLELITCAIEVCQEQLPAAKLEAELIEPVVKIPHAMAVVRKHNPKMSYLIDSLTGMEKNTLICGVHLARALGDKKVKLDILRRICLESFGIDSQMSMQDFKGIFERLIDQGLLKINGILRTDSPVAFDLQLEDVESTLESTLNGAFYERMKARIQALDVGSL